MRHQNIVFHTVLKHLPFDELERLVGAHGADDAARGFDCKSHLVTLLYGQLSGAIKLREMSDGLRSQANHLYHLGVEPPSKSTLADANRQRARAAVFSDLLTAMMRFASRPMRRTMDGVTLLIDSTALPLNARSTEWARFSATVCGAKLHVVYDPDADRPTYCSLSAGNVNDITAAKAMPIVPGATYVVDLGYYDFAWWAELDGAGCRLVTRLKRNTPLTLIEERPVPAADRNILSDRVGYLPVRQAKSRKNPFQKPVREIRVRIDTGKVLRIVTNDLAAPASKIAELYKRRWAIELFFRWIKQTLKITHFFGTSEVAVRIQVAVALIAFLLLRLAQATQSAVSSPLAFAHLVRVHLMQRRRIDRLLEPDPPPLVNPDQLFSNGAETKPDSRGLGSDHPRVSLGKSQNPPHKLVGGRAKHDHDE